MTIFSFSFPLYQSRMSVAVYSGYSSYEQISFLLYFFMLRVTKKMSAFRQATGFVTEQMTEKNGTLNLVVPAIFIKYRLRKLSGYRDAVLLTFSLYSQFMQ